MANAKSKGVHIGRIRKRNSVLIESLLEAGLSYREVARIAKCSHGSVHAQKIEFKKRKEQERLKQEEQSKHMLEEKVFSQTLPLAELSPETLAKLQAHNGRLTERTADEPEELSLY